MPAVVVANQLITALRKRSSLSSVGSNETDANSQQKLGTPSGTLTTPVTSNASPPRSPMAAQNQPNPHKLFAQFLEVTAMPKEAVEFLTKSKEEWTELLGLCDKTIPTDPVVALSTCVAICNFCSVNDCLPLIDAPRCLETLFEVLKSFPTEKKLAHLVFMTISNLSNCPSAVLTAASGKTFTLAITPLYAEGPVVEAWCAALCNLSSLLSGNRMHLVFGGAVEVVERLLVYHGDNARVTTHGLRALSNLSRIHVPLPPLEGPQAKPSSPGK
jgi:hypothetical protein